MSGTPNCPPRSKTSILLNVAMGLICMGCISITGFASTQGIKNSERLASIEALCFTAEDGLEVWKKIAELQGKPPSPALLARIARLEVRVDRLMERGR